LPGGEYRIWRRDVGTLRVVQCSPLRRRRVPATRFLPATGFNEIRVLRCCEELEDRALLRLLPSQYRLIGELAVEDGISDATLYHWRRQARVRGRLLDADAGPQGWCASGKSGAVLETATSNEAPQSFWSCQGWGRGDLEKTRMDDQHRIDQ